MASKCLQIATTCSQHHPSCLQMLLPLYIRTYCECSLRGGAGEACGAHNPKVGGSKPPLANKSFCFITSDLI
jgi:hypothetical protein